jgi:phosphatidylethanolamine-binding protein (PEBP) family uncharacterized protein
MLWKSALLVVAQLGSVIARDQQMLGSDGHSLDEIRDKLLEAEVIPTVIDDFPPALALSASWKHDSADLGNTLNPDHLKKAPKIHLDHVKSDPTLETLLKKKMSYVIVLTDPDAPSRDDPKWSEFCHWIAVGTAKTSSKTAKSSSKKHKKSKKSKNHLKDLVKYKAPAPPPKTGKHRYVFLAFVAANGTTEKLHLSKPGDRKHWGSEQPVHGVREWAHENGLAPVAANFIYAQNEEQ